MKHLLIVFLSIFLYACSGGEEVNNSGNTGGNNSDNEQTTPKPLTPVVVTPTTTLGEADAEVSHLRLSPGKLIGLEQITEKNCNRAIAANMWLDVIARDKNMWAEGSTNELREFAFYTAGEILKTTGAKLWGVHLPYSTYDIASLDEAHRKEAVAKLTHIIDIAIEHLRPYQLTIHPSTGSYLTTSADFAQHREASRRSLIALQKVIEQSNSAYGTSTILCVENCSKSVGYDGKSLIELLNVEGLESVRVCVDTGHALIPQNGSYIETKGTGDVVQILKDVGTRLGTLHIQQNIGLSEYPYDKHMEPFAGGLIDWGRVYQTLLKDCRYRGCFLYETSWVDKYGGDTKSSIESTRKNYDTVIVPAYTALKQ